MAQADEAYQDQDEHRGGSDPELASQLTPYTRGFLGFGRRESIIGDSVAERAGFELAVPVSKLADDSIQATCAT